MNAEDQKTWAEFVALFNAQKYFESHEVLEALWMRSPVERKKIYQAFIQSAVALHHLRQGKVASAQTMWARAKSKFLSGRTQKFVQAMEKIITARDSDFALKIDEQFLD